MTNTFVNSLNAYKIINTDTCLPPHSILLGFLEK